MSDQVDPDQPNDAALGLSFIEHEGTRDTIETFYGLYSERQDILRARDSDGGLSFEDRRAALDVVYDTIHELVLLTGRIHSMSGGRHRSQIWTRLRPGVETVNGALRNIQGWDITVGSPKQRHTDLSGKLEEACSKILHSARVDLAYLRTEDMKTLRDQVNRDLTLIQREKQKLDDALQTAQDIAQKVSVGHHAKLFEKQARLHSQRASRWLTATIVVAFLTVGFALYLIGDPPQGGSVVDVVRQSVPRLVILSVLYWMLVWFGKSYRAERHNQLVNEHRQNALNTFQIFVDTAEDDKTKAEVLRRAAGTVFNPVSTSYDDARGESGPGLAQVNQFVRGAADAARGS